MQVVSLAAPVPRSGHAPARIIVSEAIDGRLYDVATVGDSWTPAAAQMAWGCNERCFPLRARQASWDVCRSMRVFSSRSAGPARRGPTTYESRCRAGRLNSFARGDSRGGFHAADPLPKPVPKLVESAAPDRTQRNPGNKDSPLATPRNHDKTKCRRLLTRFAA